MRDFFWITLVVFWVAISGPADVPAQETGADTQPDMPLAEAGPYPVGLLTATFIDTIRDDRVLPLSVWYPAQEEHTHQRSTLQTGAAMAIEVTALTPAKSLRDISTVIAAGEPVDVIMLDGMFTEVIYGETSGYVLTSTLMNGPSMPLTDSAPYPLILFSHWATSDRWTDAPLLEHLASHGFVVVSIGHQCDYDATCFIDRPLDIHFVLDQIAEGAVPMLAQITDENQVGVMGISYGGYATLAAAGGRVNSDQFIDWSTDGARAQNPWHSFLQTHVIQHWDEVIAYQAQLGLQDGDAYWAPLNDTRIRAIMPIVPSAGALFSDHGLETVRVPTLMIAGFTDRYVEYEQEIIRMYEQLTGIDKRLITFIQDGHHPEWTRLGAAQYRHFSTAFFGHYLQSQDTYSMYLTEDHVNSFSNLLAGIYTDN